MSARIPDTLLVSEVLKPTGFDCPEDLEGVSFNEAVSGEGASIEANKAATIDVSTYTEPVAITPTAGKDGMAKATVTLTNIPSSGGITYRAWKASTNDYIAYAYVKDGVDIQVGMSSGSITGFNVRITGTCSAGAFVNTVKSVSEGTIVTNSSTPFPELTWTRDSSADITI